MGFAQVAWMALAERTVYWQQTVMGFTPLTEQVAVVKLPVQVGDVPTQWSGSSVFSKDTWRLILWPESNLGKRFGLDGLPAR